MIFRRNFDDSCCSAVLARSVCFTLVHGDISSMFPSLICEYSDFSSCYGEHAICWCFADVNLFEEGDRENSFFVLLILIRTSANFGSKKFCNRGLLQVGVNVARSRKKKAV